MNIFFTILTLTKINSTLNAFLVTDAIQRSEEIGYKLNDMWLNHKPNVGCFSIFPGIKTDTIALLKIYKD